MIEIVNAAGTVTYRNSFITDLEVGPHTGVDPAAVVAPAACRRGRWKIENESFNVLKNNGYHLEHNFGHGKVNLAAVFVSLNLLAFAFHSAACGPQPKAAVPRWSGFDLESQDLQPDDPVNHSDGAAMNGFVDLHGESITGVINTFDRVIFKGHLNGFFPDGAFGRYLSRRGILLKDAGRFFEAETQR